MWCSSRRVLQDVLGQAAVRLSGRSLSLTPVQNTVVVERMWKVPLSKEGSPPRLYGRRHKIYKMVDNVQRSPTKEKKMELILTQTVPKLGGRGDSVVVKKSVGRNKLLPQGVAVYPSPENKEMFAEELKMLSEGTPEGKVQTRTGQLTVDYLKKFKLRIPKMPAEEFQLNKEFVCRVFQRRMSVFVPPHALTLPFEPITEVGDYWCDVTVNGLQTVRVPIALVPYDDVHMNHAIRIKVAEDRAPEAAGEGAAVLQAVSDAAVETEATEDSVSPSSEAPVTQTTQDTTASPGDGPKKD